MRIKQTKDSLLGWLLLPLLVLVTGPIQLVVFSPQTNTLICNRVQLKQVDCWKKYSLMGLEVRKVSIGSLYKVAVVQAPSSSGIKYQLMLFTSVGNQRFGFPNERKQSQAIASRINNFLKTPAQPSLTIQDNYWIWQATLLSALMTAMWIWVIIWAIKYSMGNKLQLNNQQIKLPER